MQVANVLLCSKINTNFPCFFRIEKNWRFDMILLHLRQLLATYSWFVVLIKIHFGTYSKWYLLVQLSRNTLMSLDFAKDGTNSSQKFGKCDWRDMTLLGWLVDRYPRIRLTSWILLTLISWYRDNLHCVTGELTLF